MDTMHHVNYLLDSVGDSIKALVLIEHHGDPTSRKLATEALNAMSGRSPRIGDLIVSARSIVNR